MTTHTDRQAELDIFASFASDPAEQTLGQGVAIATLRKFNQGLIGVTAARRKATGFCRSNDPAIRETGRQIINAVEASLDPRPRF